MSVIDIGSDVDGDWVERSEIAKFSLRSQLVHGNRDTVSEMSSSQFTEFTDALQSSAADYGVTLDQRSLDGLCAYYETLNSWNARLHLVAPTPPADFATRHILESLTVVHHLYDNAKVADVGSGGGLPIVPVLIVRRDITATLIESSRKKAVFLREVLKETMTATRGTVINERFENVSTPAVDYVTCRAIERFEELIPKLVEWAPAGTGLLLFGGESLKKPLESAGLVIESKLLPKSKRRFLIVARKQGM